MSNNTMTTNRACANAYVVVIQDADLTERAYEIVADSNRMARLAALRWCRAHNDVDNTKQWEITRFYTEGVDDVAIEQVRDRLYGATAVFDTIYV